MSPKVSMNLMTDAPEIGDPLLATTLSDDVSYRFTTAAGNSSMRCNITGTNIRTVQRCSAMVLRHSSASNRSISTTVASSGVLNCSAARPQE
jgi:hypothetical protein